MSFKPHTKEELDELQLDVNQTYTIQYMNRDYFNAQESIEIVKNAKVILQGNEYIFIVTDPYGMDKYIKEVRVIQ